MNNNWALITIVNNVGRKREYKQNERWKVYDDFMKEGWREVKNELVGLAEW